MKNINTQRRLLIKGNHYYTMPFLFSNVYGKTMFSHGNHRGEARDLSGETAPELFDSMDYHHPNTELLSLRNSPLFPILSQINGELFSHIEPEQRASPHDEENEVELYTDGLLQEDDGVKIIYGDGDFPISLHIGNDGIVTLDSENEAVPTLTFEKGKRHFANLSPMFKLGLLQGEQDAPVQICVYTHEMKNELLQSSRTLEITYSIEIAGSQAEKTNFSITVLSK